MINFNLLNSIDFSTNINEKFVYNYYSPIESKDNIDLEIKNSNVKSARFIQLDIENYSKYNNNKKIKYSNLIENTINFIKTSFSNKSLNTNELRYFNKLHNKNKMTVDVILDKKDDEIQKINSFFEIKTDNHARAIDFYKRNTKINISKFKKENFYNVNNSSFFTTNDIVNSIDTFQQILQPEVFSQQDHRIRINDDFIPISRHSSTRTDDVYYQTIGFLVEKYEYNEDDDKNILKDIRFFEENEVRDTSDAVEIVKKNNLSLKDTAVKYGSTYFYIVYNVFVLTQPSKGDYNFLDTFIICDYPYITKKVKCSETKRPQPPSHFIFKYEKINKRLRIQWSKPVEKQGDIRGYQVFKRESLEEPYKLIKQIEFYNQFDNFTRNPFVEDEFVKKYDYNKTECYDESFVNGKVQIYTVCSIDARGFTSNYGSQLAVYYENQTKKCIVDLISKPGAPLHMPNLLMPRKTKFFDNDNYIVTNVPIEEKVKKFTLYVTPECYQFERNDGNGIKLLKENYKLNIYNLENKENIIKEFSINNFDIED